MYDLDALNIKLVESDQPDDDQIMQSYLDDMWIESHDGKRRINENTFAEAFTEINHLRYNNGLFYTRHGKMTEEYLAHEVWDSIRDVNFNTDVGRTVKKLVEAIKLASTVKSFDHNERTIPFHNGDLILLQDNNWEFRENDFSATPYRLPCDLCYSFPATPNFNKWLHDLFYDADILTIQEYLGYCLLPHTKAQKALFLVGAGGAGKSVMGVILQAMLGEAMYSTANTKEFLQDKFKLPELEHKLVLYDDDLDSSALDSTGLYKKLITNTQEIKADRKYGHPFSFYPYVKLVCCCNEMLTSLYDNTDGFYRRLLPIQIKPIAPDFKPDRFFYDKVRSEIGGIIPWAIQGLNRLIEHNWTLYESSRSQTYLSQKKSIGNHFPDFLHDCFELTHDDSSVPSVQIADQYRRWCQLNGIEGKKIRSLWVWLSDNAESMGITSDNHVTWEDKEVRGYRGLKKRESMGKIGKRSKKIQLT